MYVQQKNRQCSDMLYLFSFTYDLENTVQLKTGEKFMGWCNCGPLALNIREDNWQAIKDLVG